MLASGPAAAVEAAEVVAELKAFNANSRYDLPLLRAEELDALIGGQTVRRLENAKDERPARALALVLTTVPREDVWWSCQDPHFSAGPEMIDMLLDRQGPDRETWYGLLDAPVPLADRQWVVDIWNEHGVAQASAGRHWEHGWRLRADGPALIATALASGAATKLPPERAESAVWLEASEGAWVALSLSDGTTLFGYHSVASLGGAVPDWIVGRVAYAGLDKMMRRIIDRAAARAGHYTAGHAPVYDGAGQAIPIR